MAQLLGERVRTKIVGFGIHEGEVVEELDDGKFLVKFDDKEERAYTRAAVEKMVISAPAEADSPVRPIAAPNSESPRVRARTAEQPDDDFKGRRLSLLFSGDIPPKWYAGEVADSKLDRGEQMHQIRFDDGDTRWCCLREQEGAGRLKWAEAEAVELGASAQPPPQPKRKAEAKPKPGGTKVEVKSEAKPEAKRRRALPAAATAGKPAPPGSPCDSPSCPAVGRLPRAAATAAASRWRANSGEAGEEGTEMQVEQDSEMEEDAYTDDDDEDDEEEEEEEDDEEDDKEEEEEEKAAEGRKARGKRAASTRASEPKGGSKASRRLAKRGREEQKAAAARSIAARGLPQGSLAMGKGGFEVGSPLTHTRAAVSTSTTPHPTPPPPTSSCFAGALPRRRGAATPDGGGGAQGLRAGGEGAMRGRQAAARHGPRFDQGLLQGRVSRARHLSASGPTLII